MSSKFSIGAMNQLAGALDVAGYTSADVTKLKQCDLRKILDVLRGYAEIKILEHVIDCDAPVFVPEGLEVLPESEQLPKRIRGQYKFDPQKISFYLSKKQDNGIICGNDLRKELADKPVLNANVLDYLLAHQEVILEEWKGKYIFFWGTIYCHVDGGLCVRYLDWGGSQWDWRFHWLVSDFDADDPAALAS